MDRFRIGGYYGKGFQRGESFRRSLNLSVAELSSLMGRSRQTVSKTPDAESLQEPLRDYARVARLLSVLPAKDMRAWLNLPNARLDSGSPLQAVRAEYVGPVALMVGG